MLKIIWSDIKEFMHANKLIFIFSVLAFTFSCIAVNNTLFYYLELRADQQAYEESYGGRSYYKIILEGETSSYMNVFNEENFENLKSTFEQLKSDTSFKFVYTAENIINFYDNSDSSYGVDDFPAYKHEFLYGYEDGLAMLFDDYLELKAFYVDNTFQDEPNIKLDSGKWFSEADFYVDDPDNIYLPVILGYSYQDLYQLGDEITNAHIGTEEEATLHVSGFFAENSCFYDNNNEKTILNRYMAVPAVETRYDYTLENGSIDSFARSSYDEFKLINSRIICYQEAAEAVTQKVYEIFRQNGFYEFKLFDESGGWVEILEEYKSTAVSSMIISIFIILLSVIMFCIQSYYKLLKNRRKYAVLMMSGIRKRQLFMIITMDTFAVFFISNLLFVILSYALNHLDAVGIPITGYTFIAIAALELILLCFMGWFGCKKAYRINMSGALRENE